MDREPAKIQVRGVLRRVRAVTSPPREKRAKGQLVLVISPWRGPFLRVARRGFLF